jgi:GT2 family glycosyltransferase
MIELSVLIATRNRHDLLRRCLDSLGSQTQDPADFEVIVADDGSSDGSAAMAEGLATPFRLRALRLEGGGQAAAQNAALEVAEGEACLFLDDDVIASPDLIMEHVKAHREDARAVGIGSLRQQPPDRPDWYALMFARTWNAHYEKFDDEEPQWFDCYGANISAPRAKLAEVGGVATEFDVGFDLELGYRLEKAGCTFRYLPQAHGVHDDQKRGRQMLLNARRQGVSHVELAHRHPEMTSWLLGWIGPAGPVELAVRRLLIALRVPPTVLARLGPLVPGAELQGRAFSAIKRLAFWQGARDSLSPEAWRRIATVSGQGTREGQTDPAAE